jgi:ribonuclease PH
MLGEITVIVDCDVIEADGGTRTASITGGCVALYDAIASVGYSDNPINYLVSAISVGVVDGNPLLDLNYEEDSSAQVDLNVVMAESGAYIEVQGTAEKYPFTPEQLQQMLDLARGGCQQLFQAQRNALGIED